MRLQRELQDHVILCGYGHSGSIAANELLLRGWQPEQIAVIDPDREEAARAADRGFIGFHGDASSEAILRVAGIERAHSVIVSVGRDDTTVLIVLTVRALAATSASSPACRTRERQDRALGWRRRDRLAIALWRFPDGGRGRDAGDGRVHVRPGVVPRRCQLVEREARPEEVGSLRARPRARSSSRCVAGKRFGCWRDRNSHRSRGSPDRDRRPRP